MKIFRFLGFLTLVGLFFIASCSKSSSYNGSGGGGGGTSTNAVSMASMSFGPATITVKAGTTVTWTNNDNVHHTVTADDASFDSGEMLPGATYTHTFSSAGTVKYHCKYHSMMVGTVTVN